MGRCLIFVSEISEWTTLHQPPFETVEHWSKVRCVQSSQGRGCRSSIQTHTNACKHIQTHTNVVNDYYCNPFSMVRVFVNSHASSYIEICSILSVLNSLHLEITRALNFETIYRENPKIGNYPSSACPYVK
jgi:hypothetical protein